MFIRTWTIWKLPKLFAYFSGVTASKSRSFHCIQNPIASQPPSINVITERLNECWMMLMENYLMVCKQYIIYLVVLFAQTFNQTEFEKKFKWITCHQLNRSFSSTTIEHRRHGNRFNQSEQFTYGYCWSSHVRINVQWIKR